jgi:chromosome segregation ATPase
MAYLDMGAAIREKAIADKYEELKKHIRAVDENGKVNEWFLAYEHMIHLENELKQKDEQIKEYQSFFSLLRKLLPSVPSIYDKIG